MPDRVRAACRGGVFQISRFAAALPLVGGVEGESDDAPEGQRLGVVGADLLLHAAARCGDEHSRVPSGLVKAGGEVEVPGEVDECRYPAELAARLMMPKASVAVYLRRRQGLRSTRDR